VKNGTGIGGIDLTIANGNALRAHIECKSCDYTDYESDYSHPLLIF
jgi:hypothetical protein